MNIGWFEGKQAINKPIDQRHYVSECANLQGFGVVFIELQSTKRNYTKHY